MSDKIGTALTTPLTRLQLDQFKAEIEEARVAATSMIKGKPVHSKYQCFTPKMIMLHVNAGTAGLALVDKGLDILRSTDKISITVDNRNLDIQPADQNDRASVRLVREVVNQASLSGGQVLAKVFGLAQAELGFKATENTRPGAQVRTFELSRDIA